MLLFLLTSTVSLYAAQRYYKYVDKDGNTIISHYLPAEAANRGYAVVTTRGNVIEVVQPKKSTDQLAKDLEIEKEKLAKQQEEEKQKQLADEQARKDEIILKTFSSEQDITRSRDEKISSIEILEGITTENISRLKQQLETARTNAASYERSSQAIPQEITDTIELSKRQIQENEEFLKRKELEKKQIHVKYDQILDRFRILR